MIDLEEDIAAITKLNTFCEGESLPVASAIRHLLVKSSNSSSIKHSTVLIIMVAAVRIDTTPLTPTLHTCSVREYRD